MTDPSDMNSSLARHRSCTMMDPVLERAAETRKKNPLLLDRKAVEIEKTIQSIQGNRKSGEGWNHYACILKTLCYDRLIKDFIWRHPGGTVLNIGCALDTTFDRLKPESILWYDLDIPEIIGVRKLFFKETPQRRFISSSLLSDEWLSEICFTEALLVFSCSVLNYYDEMQIRELIDKLCISFPSFELLFDIKSPAGLKTAGRMPGKWMKDPPLLKWSVKDYHDILKWNPRMIFLGKYGSIHPGWIHTPFRYLIRGLVSDAFSLDQVIHIRMRYNYASIP